LNFHILPVFSTPSSISTALDLSMDLSLIKTGFPEPV